MWVGGREEGRATDGRGQCVQGHEVEGLQETSSSRRLTATSPRPKK